MTSDDYTKIRVGDHDIGLIGLRQVLADIARSHGSKSHAEIQRVLLEKLSGKNYIPRSAREAYSKALVREFRKSLGQAGDGSEDSGPLRISVLGPGCSQCDRLEQTVMQVLSEMGLPASVEHVTDIKEIAKYGFIQTPALMINGKIVAKGLVPSAKKIREWLTAANPS